MGLPADYCYGKCMSAVDTVRPSSRPAPEVRAITILGATGSIGASTLDLIKRAPERYRVESITARRNAAALGKIAREVGARHAVVADPAAYRDLKEALSGSQTEAAAGEDALVEAAQRPGDWVMAAISGSVGLKPTLAAIERGATVALANKECLVCAGNLFMRQAAATGATVLPVDSEHNAVFQALGAGNRADVRRAILTASGGPFRTWSMEAIQAATPEQALRHPNWSMGPKVTVDSATLMNKGLELIEAHHLFGVGLDLIDVVIHPQSVVHSLVEFVDGSVKAQLGHPDMRLPIAIALGYPERLPGVIPAAQAAEVGRLDFHPLDPDRFPAVGLARRAAEAGKGAPACLNAANEEAVAAFLRGELPFGRIIPAVAAALAAFPGTGPDLDAVLAADEWARDYFKAKSGKLPA